MKKLGKLIAFTAVVCAAVAGGIALYNKFKDNFGSSDDDFDEFDDFDDFDGDFADSETDRGYTSLNADEKSDEAEAKDTSEE